MGTICYRPKTEYESLVDAVFSSLVLRSFTYLEISNELENIKDKETLYVTETNFQTFFNKFLTSSLFPDSKNSLFFYWIDFYRSKPVKYQHILFKFSFMSLSFTNILTGISQAECDTFSSIISQYKTLNDRNDKQSVSSSKEAKHISLEELAYLLKDYISSVSLLTVNYFKNLYSTPNEFRDFLRKQWSLEIIDEFVKKTFFTKEEILTGKIIIKKFVKTHLALLKDDCLIRRKMTEFSIDYYEKVDNHDLVLNLNSESYMDD